MAQMQALPTVLAPIVRMRKEELAERACATSRPAAIRSAAPSARSCSKAWRPTAACTCRSAIRRSTPPRSRKWRELPYAELAFEILSLYIDDIPPADLRRCAARPTPRTVFGTRRRSCRCASWKTAPCLEALSNGPTLAFKDMAMQLLGNLFEYELARRGEELNILGATSGDTGSAAEYAMRGKKGVRVFMTSPARPHEPLPAGADVQPAGREHPQHRHRRRVRRLPGHRQGGLERPGVQAPATRSAPSTRSTGRACWRRWSTTSPATSRPPANNEQKVSFAVPSGNFGNICAGHVARMMGLPIDQLVVATNENDVLDEFFRTGVYRVRGSAETHETSSPSMDISKACNFERFVFDLLGRDAAKRRALFDGELGTSGRFDLSGDPAFAQAATRFGFVSRPQHARRPPRHHPRHRRALRHR